MFHTKGSNPFLSVELIELQMHVEMWYLLPRTEVNLQGVAFVEVALEYCPYQYRKTKELFDFFVIQIKKIYHSPHVD